MKKFAIIINILLCNIALAAGSIQSNTQIHPSLKLTQHQRITTAENQQFVLGCDITISMTTIGLFSITNNKPTLLLEYQTPTKQISDIYDYTKKVVNDLQRQGVSTITATCFAIPGTVQANAKYFIHQHLPWSTSSDPRDAQDTSKHGLNKDLFEQKSGLQNIYFINDFQAAAIGIQALPNSEITTLQTGNARPQTTKLVIGAGNGLGASLLLWNHSLQKYTPALLNYSFTEYGAQTELEYKYFQFLKQTTGNIAWGKVLGTAGGIAIMYKFLDQQRTYKTDAFVDYQNSDYLTIFANKSKSLRCKDAVEFYMSQYIRFIRNATYAQAPYAGVYITNSVAQKNPELFNTSSKFIEKLINLKDIVIDQASKTYLENYLKEIPVYLIANEQVQLYGAALICVEPNLIAR